MSRSFRFRNVWSTSQYLTSLFVIFRNFLLYSSFSTLLFTSLLSSSLNHPSLAPPSSYTSPPPTSLSLPPSRVSFSQAAKTLCSGPLSRSTISATNTICRRAEETIQITNSNKELPPSTSGCCSAGSTAGKTPICFILSVFFLFSIVYFLSLLLIRVSLLLYYESTAVSHFLE